MSDWLGMATGPKTPRPELKARVLARALAPRARPPAWAWAAAAVLGAAVVGGGAWARGRIRGLEQRVAAIQDTLAFVRGPTTRAVHIPVTTGGQSGSVTIFVDTLRHRWLVRCENLAPNAPDEAYQLWFVTDAGVRHAELMPMDTDEPMIMVLEMPREGPPVRGAAMSVEPRTGSAEPRGPTVFKQLL